MKNFLRTTNKKMFKVSDLYYKISPFSLAAIVVLNFLLIYLNLVALQNQGLILQDIAENTQIGLENQQIGLNATEVNHDMLEQIIAVQETLNQTLRNLNISDSQ